METVYMYEELNRYFLIDSIFRKKNFLAFISFMYCMTIQMI